MRTTSNGSRRAPIEASYASLRVSRWFAVQLWWHGWRDRRAGLPRIPEDDSIPAATPFLRELRHHRGEVVEHERGRAMTDAERLRERRQMIAERLHQVAACGSGLPSAGEQAARRVRELECAHEVLTSKIEGIATGAQHRARRFDEFSERCVARYVRVLVRRNPSGAALTDLGWPAPEVLPDWVTSPHPAVVLFDEAGPAGGTR